MATKKDEKLYSHLHKAVYISHELCDFFGFEKGTKLSRVDAIRLLHEYIRNNSLRNITNKRQINLDTKLFNLLKFKNGEELSDFNLCKNFLNHFPEGVDDETKMLAEFSKPQPCYNAELEKQILQVERILKEEKEKSQINLFSDVRF